MEVSFQLGITLKLLFQIYMLGMEVKLLIFSLFVHSSNRGIYNIIRLQERLLIKRTFLTAANAAVE